MSGRRIDHASGSRPILWVLAGILGVLMFAGGPGYHSPRSLQATWNLGHVAAFSVWSYLLASGRMVRESKPARQWGIVLSFCVLLGAATEGFQWLLGGDASAGDLLRDLLGGLFTLTWLRPTANLPFRGARRAGKAIAAALLLLACLPFAASFCDETIARKQFPVLSDFETPFEATRWEGSARFRVDRSVARRGRASLRVDLDTSTYSGVFLVYFPGDWRRYRFLSLEGFNPSSEEIEIVCRIHDRQHESGEQRYDDRFNDRFRLLPGWNGLRIDLGEVARGPAGRTMDLGQIRSVGFFAVRLHRPLTLFLDHVRLEE